MRPPAYLPGLGRFLSLWSQFNFTSRPLKPSQSSFCKITHLCASSTTRYMSLWAWGQRHLETRYYGTLMGHYVTMAGSTHQCNNFTVIWVLDTPDEKGLVKARGVIWETQPGSTIHIDSRGLQRSRADRLYRTHLTFVQLSRLALHNQRWFASPLFAPSSRRGIPPDKIMHISMTSSTSCRVCYVLLFL